MSSLSQLHLHNILSCDDIDKSQHIIHQHNIEKLINTYESIMVLKILVDIEDEDLHEAYEKYIEKHNNSILTNNYYDSGFDILSPTHLFIEKKTDTLKFRYDMKLKTSARIVTNYNIRPTGYYLYPRSSISKSNIRLSNSIGIIDSGYRGNLLACFDIFNNNEDVIISPQERYCQICSPNLTPIYVLKVNDKSMFDDVTERGTGGIGSTGK